MVLNFDRVEAIASEVWDAAKDYYYEISAYETEDLIKTNNMAQYLDAEYSIFNEEEFNEYDPDHGIPEGFIAAATFHQGDLGVFTSQTPEAEVYAYFTQGYEPEIDASEEEIANSWRVNHLKTAIETWENLRAKGAA